MSEKTVVTLCEPQARVHELEFLLGVHAADHYEYLPAGVDYYCCGGCNQITSGYVKWPCAHAPERTT